MTDLFVGNINFTRRVAQPQSHRFLFSVRSHHNPTTHVMLLFKGRVSAPRLIVYPIFRFCDYNLHAESSHSNGKQNVSFKTKQIGNITEGSRVNRNTL